MTVASTYAASANVVLLGSKFDHVSGTNLSTVGTIAASSDGDGAYIEAATQPGNRLTASTLPRITKASGGTWVFKIKTTQSGVGSISGEIDTGTNYMENVVINQLDAGGAVLGGAVGLYIRGSASNQRFFRTPAVGINDGNVHTVAIEWTAGTTTAKIAVDGVDRTLTYYELGEPIPASGAMEFPLTIFERNLRDTTYDQGTSAKIYAYARMAASGFNLLSLSSDVSQLVSSAGATATLAITTDASVFAGLASVSPLTVLTATLADSVFSGAAGSGALASMAITTDAALFSGSASVAGAVALTLPALKNNTGTLLANETGATVYVYATTGAHVVTKTGQTTNSSGVMVITDAALTAATQYRVVIVLASGAEGMDKVTAA